MIGNYFLFLPFYLLNARILNIIQKVKNMPHSLVVNFMPKTPIYPEYLTGRHIHALFLTLVSSVDQELGLVRDPQKLFVMYLKYRGCLHLGIDPTVNLSAGSITKIFKNNGYPVMEKPYPKDDDWELFIRFWQPEKLDNPLEDGLFLDGINLRTRLWKIDSATKKKKVAIFCKCNTHENFPDDNRVVRLPFIFFVLPKNIGLAVMFFYKPNSFYIMKDIP